MRKALITGVEGFVGKHLARNLLENSYEVWGGFRNNPPSSLINIIPIEFDMSNKETVKEMLEKVRPDVIFHLAGQSSVSDSWVNIGDTFSSNVMGTINLFEGLKESSLKTHTTVISVGSSEEYGLVNCLPISEESVTEPINPYGISKLTIGKLAIIYSQSHNLNIIHVRAFNHIGPGQRTGFVTSDFAKQVAEIELGLREPEIGVGDLSSKRDFTDVRDIVEAYRLLYEKGIIGEIYNVCSGICVPIEEILNTLISFSSKSIKVTIDQSKLRPINIQEYYGSNNKLKTLTGWQPYFSLERSLADIYEYWKGNL